MDDLLALIKADDYTLIVTEFGIAQCREAPVFDPLTTDLVGADFGFPNFRRNIFEVLIQIDVDAALLQVRACFRVYVRKTRGVHLDGVVSVDGE